MSRKFYLLGLTLSLAVAALALFLYFSEISRLDTLLLSFFGLSSMGIALVIVVLSSSHPLASLGVWFTFILALQHGVGWILESIFTDQHYSRIIFFTDHTLAKSVALAGIGLLVFACTYAYYNAQRRKNNLDTDCISQTRNSIIDNIPWSILLIWGVGFLIFEITGGRELYRGTSTSLYLFRSIFGYLSKIAIILISVKLFASRLKKPLVYLGLIVLWGGFIFLTGQRQYIIGISLATFVLSYKWRLTIVKLGQMVQLALFLLLIMLGMLYLRDIYGRITFTDITLSEQIAVISKERIISQSNYRSSLEYELGYRLNAGNILLGLMADLPEVDVVWVEPVIFTLKSLVPNIIWADKVQVFQINMPRLISNHYGLSDRGDYIVTFITVFYAMGGLPMLLFLSGLFGIMIAFLDIKLTQNISILGLLLAIGMAWGLLSIDHSIDLLFVSLRDSLLLYLLVMLSISIKGGASK